MKDQERMEKGKERTSVEKVKLKMEQGKVKQDELWRMEG